MTPKIPLNQKLMNLYRFADVSQDVQAPDAALVVHHPAAAGSFFPSSIQQ